MSLQQLHGASQLGSVNADGSRKAIHTADVSGKYIRRRRILFGVLLAIYVALPLVHIGGHPAVFLDIDARRFYLFGATFNAQDVWLLLFLVTTVGFSLLFVTAWLGRAWCGWACPQTVFLEGIYRRIERLFDGSREKRIRLEKGPWTAEKILRGLGKHTAYLGISWVLAHVFLALFVSAPELKNMILEGPAGHGIAFTWAVAVSAVFYLDFAWFREQVCVVVCPYGRLQSSMQDADSIIVGYDEKRGEPRGKLIKPGMPLPLVPQGDCIDCRRCVTACPTGIDIRNGLQLECVGCAQCVDACDDVMIRIGKPTGLIRFDSLNGLQSKPKRVLRPRLYIYGGMLAASAIALTVSLFLRTPFEANALRARGVPYVLAEDGTVRNQFEVHVINKHPEPATFHLEPAKVAGAEIVVAQTGLELGSLESARVPVFVTIKRGAPESPRVPFDIAIQVRDARSGETKELKLQFLGPPGAVPGA